MYSQPGADALRRFAAREASGAGSAPAVIATSTPVLNSSAPLSASATPRASTPVAGAAGSDEEGGVLVGGSPEEGEPIGPSAADEADMRDSGLTVTRYAPPGSAPESGGKLPSLESLIAQIPPATRTALDEQLRARFVRVKRLKPGELR